METSLTFFVHVEQTLTHDGTPVYRLVGAVDADGNPLPIQPPMSIDHDTGEVTVYDSSDLVAPDGTMVKGQPIEYQPPDYLDSMLGAVGGTTPGEETPEAMPADEAREETVADEAQQDESEADQLAHVEPEIGSEHILVTDSETVTGLTADELTDVMQGDDGSDAAATPITLPRTADEIPDVSNEEADAGSLPTSPPQPVSEETLVAEEPPVIPVPLEELTKADLEQPTVLEESVDEVALQGDGAEFDEVDTDLLDEGGAPT